MAGGKKAGKLTLQEWDLIKEAYGQRCAYCGSAGLKLTKDHIIPIRHGGDHTAMNVVPACMKCNQRKHDNFWGHADPVNGCPFHPWVGKEKAVA
jgi:5-methylcytosine-specific restriction endonuclease McrA